MATASSMQDSFDWRALLGEKLVSAEEAVNHVKSGDRVTMSISHATPFTLCAALAARLMEIDSVVLNHSASLFDWDLPGLGERYRFESIYLSPIGRNLFAEGQADFVPVSYYRMGVLPPGLDHFNVFLMKVSPPDQDGLVNFGDIQIMSKLQARHADLVIAEI